MNRYCYILHFDRPFHHAKHYVGSADNVTERVAKHQSDQCDVKILIAAKAQGIGFTLAKTMRNSRKGRANKTKEYRIKASGGVGKQGLCPICKRQQ